MKSFAQAMVHHVLAAQLELEDGQIEDTQQLGDLGLRPLDLVIVVLRLEGAVQAETDFPLSALDSVDTVGDLVALVDDWYVPTSSEVRSLVHSTAA
jgi:acyl carrier protein